MICDECAWEADSTLLPHEKIARVNAQRKLRGAKPFGHKGCTGCDCKHKPRGTNIAKPLS